MRRRSAIIICSILVFLPNEASANFIWPPALYFGSFSLWWVVPSGLFVEYAILKLLLKFDGFRSAKIVLSTNFISAAVGFVVTFPITLYNPGVELVAGLYGITFLTLFSILIITLNISIETIAAHRMFGVPYSQRSLASFILANFLSFSIVAIGSVRLIEDWIRGG